MCYFFVIQMSGRPSSMWSELEEHFIAIVKDGDKWREAKCRYCAWQHCANSTRMQTHFLKNHATTLRAVRDRFIESEEAGASQNSTSSEEPAAKKPKLQQLSLLRFGDMLFTKAQQDRAEQMLCLLQVSLCFQPCEAFFSYPSRLPMHCHMPPWSRLPWLHSPSLYVETSSFLLAEHFKGDQTSCIGR